MKHTNRYTAPDIEVIELAPIKELMLDVDSGDTTNENLSKPNLNQDEEQFNGEQDNNLWEGVKPKVSAPENL